MFPAENLYDAPVRQHFPVLEAVGEDYLAVDGIHFDRERKRGIAVSPVRFRLAGHMRPHQRVQSSHDIKRITGIYWRELLNALARASIWRLWAFNSSAAIRWRSPSVRR